MNKQALMPAREAKVLEEALAALERTTGLKARATKHEFKAGGHDPDVLIEIADGGKRYHFIGEIKPTVDRKLTLAAVRDQLEEYGREAVLIAPYLTPELATHCREQLDLQFFDAAGNAYLRAPGLHVFIKGEKPPPHVLKTIGTRGGGTATALRVGFVLLCKPELLNAPYRDIVAAAGVALGAVGWVFFDLEGRGYITAGKRKRQRRLLEPGRLIDEWVTNYPIKLRPKLNARRFQAGATDWWKQAHVAGTGGLWGGEVAAYKMTDYLKPATCTLYIRPENTRTALNRLVTDHRLRADPEGNIEVLDAFWNFHAKPEKDLVPPLLVYADLMATLDPRNLEVARQIRERYIDNVIGIT